MVRKLGHKRGHFITVFLQHENICKMVRKVINNLLFRQGIYFFSKGFLKLGSTQKQLDPVRPDCSYSTTKPTFEKV